MLLSNESACNFIKKHGIQRAVFDMLKMTNEGKSLKFLSDIYHEDPAKLCRIRQAILEYTLKPEVIEYAEFLEDITMRTLEHEKKLIRDITEARNNIIDFRTAHSQ